MYIFLNDKIMPAASSLISSQDRGFLLADGLFETFKIVDKKAEYLKEHLERLFRGAEVLEIPHEINYGKISQDISDLITINEYSETVLSGRLTLTRGEGPRGLLPPQYIATTVMLTISPYTPPPDRQFKLCIASNRRNEFSTLSNLKTLSYTENILARIEAQKQGADDALFLNTRRFVACTSCANIFIISNNTLITPPISDGILPGIMRQKVIDESVIRVEERSITLEECKSADEVFITNSLVGIKKIDEIIS